MMPWPDFKIPKSRVKRTKIEEDKEEVQRGNQVLQNLSLNTPATDDQKMESCDEYSREDELDTFESVR